MLSNASTKDATELIVNYLAYRDAVRTLLVRDNANLDPTGDPSMSGNRAEVKINMNAVGSRGALNVVRGAAKV